MDEHKVFEWHLTRIVFTLTLLICASCSAEAPDRNSESISTENIRLSIAVKYVESDRTANMIVWLSDSTLQCGGLFSDRCGGNGNLIFLSGQDQIHVSSNNGQNVHDSLVSNNQYNPGEVAGPVTYQVQLERENQPSALNTFITIPGVYGARASSDGKTIGLDDPIEFSWSLSDANGIELLPLELQSAFFRFVCGEYDSTNIRFNFLDSGGGIVSPIVRSLSEIPEISALELQPPCAVSGFMDDRDIHIIEAEFDERLANEISDTVEFTIEPKIFNFSVE